MSAKGKKTGNITKIAGTTYFAGSLVLKGGAVGTLMPFSDFSRPSFQVASINVRNGTADDHKNGGDPKIRAGKKHFAVGLFSTPVTFGRFFLFR